MEGITINLKDFDDMLLNMFSIFNKYTKPEGDCCTSSRRESRQYEYKIKILINGKDEHVCTEKASSKALAELYFRDSMRAEAVPEDCRKWSYYEILNITRKE